MSQLQFQPDTIPTNPDDLTYEAKGDVFLLGEVKKMSTYYGGECFKCGRSFKKGDEIAFVPRGNGRERGRAYCPTLLCFSNPDTVPETQEAPLTVPDGYYTVVLNGDETDYVTIRIWTGLWGGDIRTVLSHLVGPDNQDHYCGFASLVNGKVRMWAKFKDSTRLRTAAEFLIATDSRKEASKTYAMQSGRCARCNLPLTVPASLHAGYGPICAAKVGVL